AVGRGFESLCSDWGSYSLVDRSCFFMNILAYFYWDPPRELFRIPFLDHPIMIYGLCFVIGFLAGYLLLIQLFKQKLDAELLLPSNKERAQFLTDKLTWYVILGTLIGARLGHVLFYDWPLYQDRPLEVFKIWQGGLASHGGILGVIIGLFFYRKKI